MSKSDDSAISSMGSSYLSPNPCAMYSTPIKKKSESFISPSGLPGNIEKCQDRLAVSPITHESSVYMKMETPDGKNKVEDLIDHSAEFEKISSVM